MKDPIYTKIIQVVYLIFAFLSFLLGLDIAYVNLNEVIERARGNTTIFSQMSWLTNTQAIWYSLAWAILFVTLLITHIYYLIKKKKKLTALVSIAICILVVLSIFVDTLFEYRSV
jgi:hypothetical protein